jgi:hypothetical protein
VNFADIRSVTTQIHDKISSGTFSSPSWDFIRTAKLAARMYAPLGTFMSLGDHVRLSRTFLEAFKAAFETETKDEDAEVVLKLHSDLKVCFHQCRCSYSVSRLRRRIKTSLHNGVSKTIGYGDLYLILLSYLDYLSDSHGPCACFQFR